MRDPPFDVIDAKCILYINVLVTFYLYPINCLRQRFSFNYYVTYIRATHKFHIFGRYTVRKYGLRGMWMYEKVV